MAAARAIAEWGNRVVDFVRAVAFWVTIVSPIVLVIALVAGISGDRPFLFAGLVLGSVACTVVGHGHTPERSGNDGESEGR